MTKVSVSQIFGRALGVGYLAYVIHTLCYICLIPLLYRHLQIEQVGLFLMLISISNFSAIGVGWISGEGLLRLSESFAARDMANVYVRYTAVSYGFGLYGGGLSLIALACGLAFGNFELFDFSLQVQMDLASACAVFAAYVLVSYIHNGDFLLLTAALRQDLAGGLRIMSSVLSLFFALIIFPFSPTLTSLMVCYFVAFMVTLLYGRYLIRSRVGLSSPRFSALESNELKKLVSHSGRRYLAYGIIQQVVYYIDTFLIGILLGPSTVAIYITVWKWVDITTMLLGKVGDVLVPYWMRMRAVGDFKRSTELAVMGVQVTALSALAGGIYYAVCAPELLTLWVGPGIIPDLGFGFLAPGIAVFLLGSCRLEVSRLYALGRTNFLCMCLVAELIIRVSAVSVFLQLRELQGYFWLVVSAQLIATWLPLTSNFFRSIGTDMRKDLFRVVVACGAGALVVCLGYVLIRAVIPNSLASAVCFGLFIGGVILVNAHLATGRGRRLSLILSEGSDG